MSGGNLYKGVATEDSDSCGKDSSLTKLTQVLNNDKEQPIQTRRLPEPPSGGNLAGEQRYIDVFTGTMSFMQFSFRAFG